MGDVSAAAAFAVIAGCLVAAVAGSARGLSTGIVLAGVGGRLAAGDVPEPLPGAFTAIAIALAAYLIAAAARGAPHGDRSPAGRSLADGAFVAIGVIAGMALATEPRWTGAPVTAAATGACLAAAIVLLWRSDAPLRLATGGVLAMVGVRVAAGAGGLSLGVLGDGALDVAFVGLAGAAVAAHDRVTPRPIAAAGEVGDAGDAEVADAEVAEVAGAEVADADVAEAPSGATAGVIEDVGADVAAGDRTADTDAGDAPAVADPTDHTGADAKTPPAASPRPPRTVRPRAPTKPPVESVRPRTRRARKPPSEDA